MGARITYSGSHITSIRTQKAENMFSNTTIVAIQCVAYIAKNQDRSPISNEEISQNIPISTSYLSKILTTLVKSGILLAHRGPSGGFILALPPEFITLLDIVEACEGKILGDYCTETLDIEKVCNYHKAMLEVRSSLIKTLKKWSIAKILEKPVPDNSIFDKVNCKMKCLSKPQDKCKKK